MTFTQPRSWYRTGLWRLRLLFPLALFAYILLFTRFGVFLIFDLLGDFSGADVTPATYQEAPIGVTHVLETPRNLALPSKIEQVSGLVVSKDEMVLATDQAEFFTWPRQTKPEIIGGSIYPFTPLLMKQGSIEAVAKIGDTYWLSGDIGGFERVDAQGHKIDFVPLPTALPVLEITGMAQATNELIISTADSTNLIGVHLETGVIRDIIVDYSELPEGSLSLNDPNWSGVSVYSDHLYAVSENYPLVAVIDPVTGIAKAAFGIQKQQGFSDISVFDGDIYLTSDHNYFDERPPIEIYTLPDHTD